MTTRLLWLSTAVTVLAVAGCKRAPAASDIDKMQGTWEITATKLGGKSVDIMKNAGMRWTIAGDQLTQSTSAGGAIKFNVRLNPTSNPKQIDLTGESGQEMRGIYTLDGDELQVCQVQVQPGHDRPDDFSTTVRGILMVFRRSK